MTWRELSPKQFNELKDALVIDVRSPCEYEEERILSAVNVPLLSDVERAQVGTLYKAEGELPAKRLALKFISPKIPEIVDRIFGMRKHGQPLVVHCWRGGLRSEAVASFLSVVGLDCFRLTGGYKAWRKQVIEFLGETELPFTVVALQGLTGVGKTDILKELSKLGFSVLDLEGLANHRGSVFGGIGLNQQPSQKNFEAAIYDKLRIINSGVVFMEAEGRKIGRLSLPKRLLSLIADAPKVLIDGSMEARTTRLVADYAGGADGNFRKEALDSLSRLKERLGGQAVGELSILLEQGRLQEIAEFLLSQYYDPLYKKQIALAGPYLLTVSGDEPVKAATELAEWQSQVIRI